MMKILVTGGAGNIGASLVSKLVSLEEHQVYVIDNLSTGRIENLGQLCRLAGFFELDINDPAALQPIENEIAELDYVIHLAAVVGVDRTLNNPLAVFRDVIGFQNVADLAVKYNVKKLLYSSSSEVYGEPVDHPQHEESTPLNAKLPYAITKLFGEKFFEAYDKLHGINCTNMRFFNTYGPRQSNDFVISRFISQALHGEDLTIFGSGLQTRSFLYIDDNIDTILKLLDRDIKLINIGSQFEISISDLARLVIDVVGSKSKVSYLPAREEGDMLRRCADNTLMCEILNRDLCPLHEGIRRTIAQYE